MSSELYFVKIGPSSTESTPSKAIQEAFNHGSSKSDSGTRLVHCYKVVGENTAVAVVQASSACAADKFISAFGQDAPLIGPGRLLDVSCNQLVSYDEIADYSKAAQNQMDHTDAASISSEQGVRPVSPASSDTKSLNEQIEEGATFWVEVQGSSSSGGIGVFSQILKNDASEARRQLMTSDAKISGFKVAGEKRLEYFISGVTARDLDAVLESMPVINMGNAIVSCRRVQSLKCLN